MIFVYFKSIGTFLLHVITRGCYYDASFRSNTDSETTDLGCVVSMTTNPSSEGQELTENTSFLLLSFDKKTIFKALNFTFALDQKCYKANVEILLELTTGQ